MATPQPEIFHEGTKFHWFVQGLVKPGASRDEIGHLLAQVYDAAAAGPPAESVAVVVAFGRSVLERIGLSDAADRLHDFQTVLGPDDLRAEATQDDLFIWLHSDRHDRNLEVAIVAQRGLATVGEAVQETPGFVYRDSRDLTGFIDGTENPDKNEAPSVAVMAAPDPLAGGSFVLAQRWVHDLDSFHSLPVSEQEAIIGRTKPDSVELDDNDPSAHVSRMVIDDGQGGELEIYRRSVPYGTAAEAGLFFLAFSNDLAILEMMLARMYGTSEDGLCDRIVEFSRAVTGSYYFAPSSEVMAALIA